MKKIVISFLSLILGAVLFAGCRSIPPPAGSGIPSGQSSPPPTTTQSQSPLSSAAGTPNSTDFAAVGLNAAIGYGTNATDWTLVTPPSSLNAAASLQGVAFDPTNISDVLAVGYIPSGGNGVFLESESDGQSGSWTVGNSNSGLTIQDPKCSSTSSTNFPAQLYGDAVFSGTAVAVGGNYTPSSPCTGVNNYPILAVSTSNNANLPYNGWQIVSTGILGLTSGTILRGVSFEENTSNAFPATSPYVAAVGDNGTILIGDGTSGPTALTDPSNWTIDKTSNATLDTLNSVAIGSVGTTLEGIAVGDNGDVYMNDNILTNTTWTKVTLPSNITPENFEGVYFIAGGLGGQSAAVVVGSEGEIFTISPCCTPNSTPATGFTPVPSSSIKLNANVSSFSLLGVWSGSGQSGSIVLASGYASTSSGITSLLLESFNSGSTWATVPISGSP